MSDFDFKKLCVNSATSNCNQIITFQQNSVNGYISCNGFSHFSEVTPKQGVHYSKCTDLTVTVYVCAKIKHS